MILEGLVVGPLGSNCYVIGDPDNKEGAIIDPGGDPEKILEVVNETGLDIKFIIATHGHFDHSAGVKHLKEKLGCDFIAHKEDLSFIREAKRSAFNWGIHIDQVPDPDRNIEGGNILKLGELELKILHTPGHSPGGISIYIEEKKILFSGDTLFFSSIGRTDFRGGSMDTLVHSIKNKLYTLPDDTVVYTGHGEPTTIGDEKRDNFFVRG